MGDRDGTDREARGMNSWRAGCVETRTSGSEGGLRKRTGRKTDTAPTCMGVVDCSRYRNEASRPVRRSLAISAQTSARPAVPEGSGLAWTGAVSSERERQLVVGRDGGRHLVQAGHPHAAARPLTTAEVCAAPELIAEVTKTRSPQTTGVLSVRSSPTRPVLPVSSP